MPAHLTPENRLRRLEALRDGLRAGRTVSDVARDLGMHPEVLRQWVNALHAASAAEKRLPTTERFCIRCRDTFASQHAGHRMCSGCRNHAPNMDSPYLPDPGGSCGRRVTPVGP